MRPTRVKIAIALFSVVLAGMTGLLMVSHAPQAMAQGRSAPANTPGVYKASVTPNWFDNGTKLWYRNDLRGGSREFIVVDAEAGTRKPAFDQKRLALALSKAGEMPVDAEHLPFE